MSKFSDYPPPNYTDVPMMEVSDSKKSVYRHRPTGCGRFASCFLLLISTVLLLSGGYMLYTSGYCDSAWSRNAANTTYTSRVITVIEWFRISSGSNKSLEDQYISSPPADQCAVPTESRIDCYPMGTQQQCLSKGLY